jgi:hypothetical protein
VAPGLPCVSRAQDAGPFSLPERSGALSLRTRRAPRQPYVCSAIEADKPRLRFRGCRQRQLGIFGARPTQARGTNHTNIIFYLLIFNPVDKQGSDETLSSGLAQTSVFFLASGLARARYGQFRLGHAVGNIIITVFNNQ